ncbi:hypothetical protein ON010_g6980 [Phytophthora cinnamomi]|nr:hypothetical protein ON010_g6980 [Phytophthora cinnamomi]
MLQEEYEGSVAQEDHPPAARGAPEARLVDPSMEEKHGGGGDRGGGGRPRENRIPSASEATTGKAPKKAHKCGRCEKLGHNKHGCDETASLRCTQHSIPFDADAHHGFLLHGYHAQVVLFRRRLLKGLLVHDDHNDVGIYFAIPVSSKTAGTFKATVTTTTLSSAAVTAGCGVARSTVPELLLL